MAVRHTTEMPPDRQKFLEEIGTLGSRQAGVALATLLKVPVSVCTLRTATACRKHHEPAPAPRRHLSGDLLYSVWRGHGQGASDSLSR
jgi:hypothetical protein